MRVLQTLALPLGYVTILIGSTTEVQRPRDIIQYLAAVVKGKGKFSYE